MIAGFPSKSSNLQHQTSISVNQDSSAPSVTTPVGELAWFCVQNPDFVKLVFQGTLTVIVLSFCMFQLASSGRDGGKNDALYWGGITSILAWWMPSPGSSSPRNQTNIEENVNIKAPVAANNPPSEIENSSVPNSTSSEREAV